MNPSHCTYCYGNAPWGVWSFLVEQSQPCLGEQHSPPTADALLGFTERWRGTAAPRVRRADVLHVRQGGMGGGEATLWGGGSSCCGAGRAVAVAVGGAAALPGRGPRAAPGVAALLGLLLPLAVLEERHLGGHTDTSQGTQGRNRPTHCPKHLLGLQVKLEKAYWDYQLLLDLQALQKRAERCKFRLPWSPTFYFLRPIHQQ